MAKSACAAPSEAVASGPAGATAGSAKGNAKFAFKCSTANCRAPLICHMPLRSQHGINIG